MLCFGHSVMINKYTIDSISIPICKIPQNVTKDGWDDSDSETECEFKIQADTVGEDWRFWGRNAGSEN